MEVLFCFASLLSLIVPGSAWLIQVDSHTDECFFEQVGKNAKVGLSFQVVEGGFLDIDVGIWSPNDDVIYAGQRETSGKYTFSAYKDGKYKVCFSNMMSTITPKWVMFHLSVESPTNRSAFVSSVSNSSNMSLQGMLVELADALKHVRYEQDYMLVRTSLHHRTGENTNRVAVRSALYVITLLFFGGLFQVWYYKRFFEVRLIA